MDLTSPSLKRRRLLQTAGCSVIAPALAIAQNSRGPSNAQSVVVTQLVDTSAGQLDVSRDFLMGSRAAWQDINARGGIKGRPVIHHSVEVDGSPSGVRAAVQAAVENPACLVISGTAGDPLAHLVVQQLRVLNVPMPHAAPWLQNSSAEVDDRTFPIFAARQEQIGHALRSLTVMGIHDLGVVYASAHEAVLYQEDIGQIAKGLGLKLASFQAQGDLDRLGRRLTPGTPAILLFVGGTPELVQFTQGLESQQRQRYLVALADVNLQTMVQMGAARHTPVIATQAVPMVNASLPVVRAYRETMAGLDTNAVVSHAGAIHSAAYGGCDSDMNYQGEMKFSYLGDRLALGNQNVQCQPDIEQLQPAIVQLFHFDDLTADVSYWMNLPGHHLTYGLDFSHDGTRLVSSSGDATALVWRLPNHKAD